MDSLFHPTRKINGFGCWQLGGGCWQLGFACWQLSFGCWQLDCGCWQLGFGCWQLGCGCWQLGCGCWQRSCGCWQLGCGCWQLGFGCWQLPCGCCSWAGLGWAAQPNIGAQPAQPSKGSGFRVLTYYYVVKGRGRSCISCHMWAVELNLSLSVVCMALGLCGLGSTARV